MPVIIKRILLFVSLVIITGVPYLIYLLYFSEGRQMKDPVQAIPDNTALIIRINSPLELLPRLTYGNRFWDEMLNYTPSRMIRETILLLDSMTRKEPKTRQILYDNPLYLTISLKNRAAFNVLFLLAVPTEFTKEELSGFFKNAYPGKITILESPYGQTGISRIYIEKREQIVYFAIWEGVCIIGFDDNIVKKSLDQLFLNTPAGTLTGFNTVAATTEENVDANLYINFPYMTLALWKMVDERYSSSLVKFARFADWSGLNVMVKEDELIFDGYTLASDNAMQTLALMSGQQPVNQTMIGILPATVTSCVVYTMHDYPGYIGNWERRLQQSAFSARKADLFQGLKEGTDTAYSSFILPWFGKQFGRCWIQPSPQSPAIQPVTIMETSHPDSALHCLSALNQLYRYQTDTIFYRDQPIFGFHAEEVINTWLKPLLEPMPLKWFIIQDRFVCFSGDQKTLQHFIQLGAREQLLRQDSTFRKATENTSGKVNISYYLKIPPLIDSLPQVAHESYLPDLLPVMDSLKKWQWLSVQLTAEDQLFYTYAKITFDPWSRNNEPRSPQPSTGNP